jgi:hypothetical protein
MVVGGLNPPGAIQGGNRKREGNPVSIDTTTDVVLFWLLNRAAELIVKYPAKRLAGWVIYLASAVQSEIIATGRDVDDIETMLCDVKSNIADREDIPF